MGALLESSRLPFAKLRTLTLKLQRQRAEQGNPALEKPGGFDYIFCR